MKASFCKQWNIVLLSVVALGVVGLVTSVAIACTPEGYVEELRYDGELPGGG